MENRACLPKHEVRRQGFSLIFNFFLISVLLLLGIALGRIVYSSFSAALAEKDKLCAFYLAEAGIEYGKVQLAKNPNFITPGLKINLGEGYFEVVKSTSSPLQSSGFYRSSHVIIKYNNVIRHYSNL